MTPHQNTSVALHQKVAHGRRYGRYSPRYKAMVHKWRFHFYGVLYDVLSNASSLDLPLDFTALEKYMGDSFAVEYRDIADLPKDFLDHLREVGEIKEGWKYIDTKKGIIYIFFDPRVSMERQRFTIAHEWGHVFQKIDGDFKMDMEAIPNEEERNAIIESVANHIAAFYLVPHPLLKAEATEAMRVYGIEEAIVPRLAVRFAVSQAVISNSFMNCRPRFQIR